VNSHPGANVLQVDKVCHELRKHKKVVRKVRRYEEVKNGCFGVQYESFDMQYKDFLQCSYKVLYILVFCMLLCFNALCFWFCKITQHD
jgi:hypothetical protein